MDDIKRILTIYKAAKKKKKYDTLKNKITYILGDEIILDMSMI